MTDRRLQGARVLIVEDEFLIADDLARTLTRAGAVPIGPAASVQHAKAELSREPVDAAVIDLNLRGDMAFGFAEEVAASKLPCVIVSGYGRASLPESLGDVPSLEKPVSPEKIVAVLAGELGRELTS